MFLTSVRAESDSSDRSPWGDFWFQPLVPKTASGVRVTPAAAMGLPTVYACISVLAKSLAMMPFMLYEPSADGRSRAKRRDHWLYRLMAKRPNRFQSPFEFKQMLQGHLALRGNAFCQIGWNGRGEAEELLPLHPDRMQAEVLKSGEYRYLYTDQFGVQHRYPRSEIWHLRWLSDDGIVGMSPIEIAREAVGEALAMQSYAARFYANDARPPGWIEFDGKFGTDSAKKNFRESWQETHGGRNRGKIAVLERGMKYHELALSNEDAQFIESRKDRVADVARIWGVPPHKIGDLSRSTNNNIEHQNIEFWTDTMMPYGKLWTDSMEFSLLVPDSGLDAEFDVKPMMRGDGQARATRIRSLVLSGVLKQNEGREEEGYDPVEGGDRLLVPVNMGIMQDDGTVEAIGGDSKAQPGAPDDGSGERMMALLRGNSSRMARRMANGGAVAPEVLGEALAIEPAAAAEWLEAMRHEVPHMSEGEVADSLVSLALGNAPNPLAASASAARRLAGAISAMPAPVVNSTVNVAPAAVTMPAPVVENHIAGPVVNLPETVVHNTVNTAAPQVDVHVPAPQVQVKTEAPVVNVEVAAPVVHAPVNVPEPKVTLVQAEPKKAGQADRPWPTRTDVLKRDAAGRADIFETRPIDD